MTCVKMAAWGILAGLTLMIPLSGGALDDQKGKVRRQVVEPQTQQLPSAADPPVYIPPQRGAPGGRVGGSSRGILDLPKLSVLAPDHTGLTVQEQPSLYWYLANSTSYPIELTLIDNRTVQPLLQTRINGPIQPGVQHVRLADYGLHLSQGLPYRWSVALIVDSTNRSRNVIAGGLIERIALPEALRAKLARAGKTQAPFIYAEAGVWYDALTSISELIDAVPNDRMLRQQRASLLEQVGLPEIAMHEMRLSRTP